MENQKTTSSNVIIPINYAEDYTKKVLRYGGSALYIGGLTSFILLGKFKAGGVFGLGVGAGYCHYELKKLMNNLFI
jgi:hypothetical protein